MLLDEATNYFVNFRKAKAEAVVFQCNHRLYGVDFSDCIIHQLPSRTCRAIVFQPKAHFACWSHARPDSFKDSLLFLQLVHAKESLIGLRKA